MAAKGYQYYRVEEFPKWNLGQKFETQHQESMFDDLDEGPKSIITHVGLADFEDFQKYHALHETYQKVTGRYRNAPINGYIAQVEFHLYRHPVKQVLFIDTKHVYCREMIERLQASKARILLVPEEIDLGRLGNDLRSNVRGAWFGDLKVANVSTIGMFGSTVGESEEWELYEQVGKLKAIDVELKIDGLLLLVKIMSNRGIVIVENLSEALSLKVLLELQEKLDEYVPNIPTKE